MRVDVHAHYWAAEYLDLLVDLGREDLAGVGRQSPDFTGRLADMDAAQVLREFWYDTSTQDMPLALLAAKQTYGADRLLLGSDAIFASVTEAVEYISSSPYLSEDEKIAILDHNAQDLLHLPEVSHRGERRSGVA